MDELDRLNAILPGHEEEPLVISVWVIAGTAGAGKTSLALRWAHQLRDRFPDGQLYVNLRGYDPGEPVGPQQALHGFLTALGVRPRAIPHDIDAAAGLYRSLLADRRVLIVLDNAATAAQVRPLLPGGTGSLAVVTSRSRLTGLSIRDGARRLTLGTLPEPEAVALLRTITADHRPQEDERKLTELARLCARLPLALRIAGERAAARPHLSLDDLVADLRDQSALWDVLSTEDGEDTEGVRAVLAWSYRALSPPAARLFRLLGIHPGPGIGLPAAAALAGLPVGRARQLLDVLVGAHLLEQTAPDRFAFHDLLRAYATAQVRHEEPPEERAAALRRVLDWYLHTADAAQEWIEPDEARVPLGSPVEGVTPLAFPDYDRAVDWAEHEHQNLLSAVRAAATAGLDRTVRHLAAVVFNALPPSAPASDWLSVAHAGLDAARRLGDRAGEAGMLECLGMGHTQAGRPDRGRPCHAEALTIRRELGDRHGEAESLNLLGLSHLRLRELSEAEACFQQAQVIFGELLSRHGQSGSLANLAAARHEAGRLDEAAEAARQALTAQRERGSSTGVGDALGLLSGICLELGRPVAARQAATEAVTIALDLRDHVLEGYWLIALGNAQRELGEHADALTSFQRSASLHRRLGDRGREAMAWHGAGETYRAMKRPEDAAPFFRRAAAAHRESGDRWHEALALAALAEDDPEQALRHRAEALRLIASYRDPRAAKLRERLEERWTGAPSV
ncbi:ATP-binding protein [Streptomyces johnsoniae]|uniref:Tetratricopeptide repeat protein n=1 Tax=Streptomyces johnsoniae TaxID=3075532 RepID=A0ABU2RYQ9_9ACTN|nr:tetratricopeptide repeat protein [Streptomyces sp. DSM 41886]MDT0441850.1 tetratricopeptide repeat protein [Streptomyces sp. DSM 41886]